MTSSPSSSEAKALSNTAYTSFPSTLLKSSGSTTGEPSAVFDETDKLESTSGSLEADHFLGEVHWTSSRSVLPTNLLGAWPFASKTPSGCFSVPASGSSGAAEVSKLWFLLLSLNMTPALQGISWFLKTCSTSLLLLKDTSSVDKASFTGDSGCQNPRDLNVMDLFRDVPKRLPTLLGELLVKDSWACCCWLNDSTTLEDWSSKGPESMAWFELTGLRYWSLAWFPMGSWCATLLCRLFRAFCRSFSKVSALSTAPHICSDDLWGDFALSFRESGLGFTFVEEPLGHGPSRTSIHWTSVDSFNWVVPLMEPKLSTFPFSCEHYM